MRVYELLEIPGIYQMAQTVLAPGMDRIVTSQLAQLFAGLPHPERVLDVGCGPASWLWKLDMKPIGLDLCDQYTRKFRAMGNASLTGSAARLPFAADSFDLVFSFALLHRLSEALARETIDEMIRATSSNGIVVFDPVLPNRPWQRPLAWTLCKLDRGRFIATEETYKSRILHATDWSVRRFNQSWLGTEGLLSLMKKCADEA